MSVRDLTFEELMLVAGGMEGNGGDQGGTGSMGGGDGQGNGAVGAADGGYGFSNVGDVSGVMAASWLTEGVKAVLHGLAYDAAKSAYQAFDDAISSGKFGTGNGIQGGNEASDALGPAFAGGYDPSFSTTYSGSN